MPSSATTVTVKVLLPMCKPVAPVTDATACESVAIATTATLAVPLATSSRLPAATLPPLTVKTARVASLENEATKTFAV